MKTTKIAVIDDELNARKGLIELLKHHFKQPFKVVSADGVVSGLKMIKKEKPDLLFTDIKMEDGTGFDMLELLDDINFPVIFTTAYDDYAVKAFQFNAIHYLLKPIDPDELINAIDKALLMNRNKNLHLSAQNLVQSYKYNNYDTIVFNTHREIKVVRIEDIAYLKADSNYCYVHFLNKERMAIPKTLKDYENLLPREKFFRAHKSYLINMGCMVAYKKQDGGYLLLSNDEQVPLAKRNKQDFMKRVNHI